MCHLSQEWTHTHFSEILNIFCHAIYSLQTPQTFFNFASVMIFWDTTISARSMLRLSESMSKADTSKECVFDWQLTFCGEEYRFFTLESKASV